MFTNLIESDSHAKEFKRRSSFFLATVAVYSLILSAAAIAAVFTYDARVEAQNTALILDYMIPPVRPVRDHEPPKPNRPAPKPASSNVAVDQNVRVPERINPTATVDPTKIPDDIGTKPPDSPPVTGTVVEGTRNLNPPGGSGNETGNCTTCPDTSGTAQVIPKPTPIPAPVTPPGPQRVTSRMLISKVIDLPKPVYPQIAKAIRRQGPVNVQILVDESGRVISAQAVSGDATLTKAAEDAARRARFTPTILNNQPVKVQGVITYNFVLQ